MPDEFTLTDDDPAANVDLSNGAGDIEILVRGVVARVVEVLGSDRPTRGWVEQDDVCVAPDLDRSLPREPDQTGRRCREDVYHPLYREAVVAALVADCKVVTYTVTPNYFGFGTLPADSVTMNAVSGGFAGSWVIENEPGG